MEYDVIIIGAGPGGLSAAVYLRRGNLKTLVLEASGAGGQMNYTTDIDNYPGFSGTGSELSEKMCEQAARLGADIKFENVLRIENADKTVKKVCTRKNEYSAPYIVFSTGAAPRKLNVSGEERLAGMGVSYCATCDGAFFKGKTTVVVGGGNTSFEDALYLSELCEKVYLVHHSERFRASAESILKAKKNLKIELVLNSEITEIIGESSVKAVRLHNNAENKDFEVKTDAVFVAIGRIPRTELSGKLLSMNRGGYIITDENMRTSIKGIYAVGDVRDTPLRQVVTAAADGAIAADDIIKSRLV